LSILCLNLLLYHHNRPEMHPGQHEGTHSSASYTCVVHKSFCLALWIVEWVDAQKKTAPAKEDFDYGRFRPQLGTVLRPVRWMSPFQDNIWHPDLEIFASVNVFEHQRVLGSKCDNLLSNAHWLAVY
jgi:hypothetical protein